jgi:hypothetical protein
VAFALQSGFQGGSRFGLATAGPVVQHFDFTRMCGHGQNGGSGQQRALERFQSFQGSLLLEANGLS